MGASMSYWPEGMTWRDYADECPTCDGMAGVDGGQCETCVSEDMCVECRVFTASRSLDYPTLCTSCATEAHRWKDAP